MRVAAIDWSGRDTGAAETIWIAEAVDRELTFLENGRDRRCVVDWLGDRRPDVTGLDFAFSFPEWFCAREGWASGPAAWAALTDARVAAMLAEREAPFWGRRRGRPAELTEDRRLRRTDAAHRTAKSIFQIGGAGAVGTGSLRGMASLRALRDEHGFAVWPFDAPGPATVVEIYPRAMYVEDGMRTVKTQWRSRHSALRRWFGDGDPGAPLPPLLERAAGSEDAFDAAVSALRMSECADELRALDPEPHPDAALEGWVWAPATPPAG